MENIDEFKINISKARKTILFFVCLSLLLVILLIVTDNKLSSLSGEFSVVIPLLLFLYCGFILLLIKRLVESFYSEPYVYIDKFHLTIPTFYLGKRKYFINDIYSLEVWEVNKSNEILILGIEGKSRLFVDEKLFSNKKEYENFKNKINGLVNRNANNETIKSIKNISAFQKTKLTSATIILFFLCLIIYFFSTHGSMEPPENPEFILLGAGEKNIIGTGEIYRIFSAIFLHVSIFHLFLNLFVLGIIGELIERVISFIRFINIFLLSSLISFVFFVLFSSYEIGVGASGGIFGLWGAYFSLKLRYEKYLPGSVNAISIRRLTWVFLIELLVEVFILSNVGVEVHIGGFLSGFIYLYFMPLGPKLETIDQPTIYEKVLFAILVSCYSIGLSYFLLLYYGLI